ncbi:Efflux transporter, RND family, MFP subunit [Syntrophobacter sp. SbD1]|nr:Efflux transporter, RND family, MFP subunit [Syntrophobacter sp. SbD1]
MPESDSITDRKRRVLAIGKGAGALAVLIVLMSWLAGGFVKKVGPEAAGHEPSQQKPATERVERKTFPLMIEQVGAIRSGSEAQVSSRLMAEVREIRVKEGDRVSGPEAGHPTVLATLDDRDVRAKLRQADWQVDAVFHAIDGARAKLRAAQDQVSASKANQEKASLDYRRYENLLKNGAATEQQAQNARAQRDVTSAQAGSATQEVEAAQGEIARLGAQREQAEAAVKEARVMLSYTIIEAPFSGRVVKKMINAGDMAAPGQPVFFLDAPSQAEVHAIVSESLVPHLQIGEHIEVGIDALDSTMEGEIREIVPQSDTATRTMLVKIGLPASPGLVSGLFARIYVPYGTYDALVIPARAVREVGQLCLTDVVGLNGRPSRRFITVGRTRGPLIEVLSGLSEGEDVSVQKAQSEE